MAHQADLDASLPSSLAVPEPDLTPDALVARAEALRPLLLDDQAATEARGCYSPAMHQAFVDAGFYRTLQPRRFGGYEFDLPTFFKVMIEIARGCPSTGWGLCFAAGHVLPFASHFPAAAQVEAFGDDGEFRAPHRAGPGGTATPVDGGYLVSGRWDYSSGITYATHFMGTALAQPAGGGPPTPLVVVVPRDRCQVLDDWGGDAILGMRGSGSNTVELDDVVVPEAFTTPYDWLLRDVSRGTPGTALHANAMYLGRTTSFYHAELVSVAVGTAKAAIDEYEVLLQSKKTLLPPQVLRVQHFDFQRDYGLALGMVDSAAALLLRAGEEYMQRGRAWAEQGIDYTPEADMRLYAMVLNAGRLAAEATEALFRSATSGAAKRGQRMERYYRDISIYRGHNSAQYLNSATVLARLRFGLPVRGHFQAPLG